MKYSRAQFTTELYQLWEAGLVIPAPRNTSNYTVKFRKNFMDHYSRVTLPANSVYDALERACYAVADFNLWRPEDIDVQAVYDNEENLLWIDEPYYTIVQKKNEFRGISRRDFFSIFGATTAALLFGQLPRQAYGVSTGVTLSGSASGFSGEQVYVTPGTYSWVVPSNVTSVCVVCIGGGGAGGGVGASNGTSVTGGSGGASSALGLTAFGGSGGVGGSSASMAGGAGGTSSGGSYNYSGGAGSVGCVGYWMRGGGGGNVSNYSTNGATGVYPSDCGTYTWTNGPAGAGASIFGSSGSGTKYGAGGGGYTDHFGGGGGGGAGGLAYSNSVVVTPGSSKSISVGGAGLRADGGASSAVGGAVRIIWGSGRSFPGAAS